MPDPKKKDDADAMYADLEAYTLDKTGPVSSAWLENIPEWPAIRKMYASGVSARLIRQWLIDNRGYTEAEVSWGRWQHIYKTQARVRRG